MFLLANISLLEANLEKKLIQLGGLHTFKISKFELLLIQSLENVFLKVNSFVK